MKIRRLAFVAFAVGACACTGAGWAAGESPTDRGVEEAQAAGKTLLASARWQVPSIEAMWTLRSEPGGPLIVLAEKSITALSKTDGKQLWKVTEGVDLPAVIGSNDKVLIVRKTSQTRNDALEIVTALSLADGTEKYQLPGSSGHHEEQVRGKLIVVATGLATPNFGPTARPRPLPVPQLTGYDLNTGKQLWQRDSMKIEFFRGFISDTQYLTILNDVITMLDPATGTSQWERQIESGWKGGGDQFRTDGTALLLEYHDGTANQRLLTMDLKTGKTTNRVEVASEGYVVAATDGVLVLQRLRKSSTVRTYDFETTVELTEEDKKEKIAVIDARSGKAQWTLAIPQDKVTYDDLALAGDVLLRGNPGSLSSGGPLDGRPWTLTALDLATGKPLWTREQMAGTPVAYKEIMFLTTLNSLEAADRRTGKSLWTIPTAGLPSEPLILDGVLYFGVSTSGKPTPGRFAGICAIALEKK